MKENTTGGGSPARQLLLLLVRQRCIVATVYFSICFFMGTRLSYYNYNLHLQQPPPYEIEDALDIDNITSEILRLENDTQLSKSLSVKGFSPFSITEYGNRNGQKCTGKPSFRNFLPGEPVVRFVEWIKLLFD